MKASQIPAATDANTATAGSCAGSFTSRETDARPDPNSVTPEIGAHQPRAHDRDRLRGS